MSKELEALKRLLNHCGNTEDGYYECDIDIEDYETVKSALNALNIIKTKKVDVNQDIFCSKDYKHYLSKAEKYKYENILSEEEFNLLKEMIKNA